MTTHVYSTRLAWQGSTGAGYRGYGRNHRAGAPGTGEVDLSADPHFEGDADLLNPEQLLVMAASSCQLLSMLSVAARRGIDIVAYEDDATGHMPEATKPMRIETIDLRPVITVVPGTDQAAVLEAVEEAHRACFIANSLNTEIAIHPTVLGA